MRPDAASFSPVIGTPLSFDPYTAMVTHSKCTTYASESEPTLSDTTSIKTPEETPRDMIVHESIKGLLEKMDQLEKRCNELESANADLKSEMALIKADRSVNGALYAMNGNHHSVNGNLTGYESSSNGSERDVSTSAQGAASESSTKVHELQCKIDMISEVLTDHEKRIEGQATQQKEQESRFTRKDYDQTSLKGRTGRLEKDLKALEEKVDEASVDNNRGRALTKTGSAADVGSYLMDELQQVQMRLADLTKGCQINWDELEGKCNALAAVVENGSTEPRAGGWSVQPSSIDFQVKALREDIVELKEWQRQEQRKANNVQNINEASTIDALDAMFFQLTHIMGEDNDETIWCKGSFATTAEDAFGLRDHVICRLALFNPYAAALKTVQAKKGQVDW